MVGEPFAVGIRHVLCGRETPEGGIEFFVSPVSKARPFDRLRAGSGAPAVGRTLAGARMSFIVPWSPSARDQGHPAMV